MLFSVLEDIIRQGPQYSIDELITKMRDMICDPPLPYKISTITATGCMGCRVDIYALYDAITVENEHIQQTKTDAFLYMELNKEDGLTHFKGFHKKMLVKHRSKTQKKRFDKQITAIIRKYEPESDTFLYQNVKIFHNGVIQMTGLKHPLQGHWVLLYILKTIQDVLPCSAFDPTPFPDAIQMKPSHYQIQLINCDFKLPFSINRYRMKDVILTHYGVTAHYEPLDYPGLKVSYVWNAMIPREKRNGQCQCPRKCHIVRGQGMEWEDCKRVTVIIFQSGSIIITGAQSLEQTNDAHDFILDLASKERHAIEKKSYSEETETLSLHHPVTNAKTTEKKKKRERVYIPENYVNDLC